MSFFETDGEQDRDQENQDYAFGDSLRGSIIMANPHLKEPTFRQSVLLLTEHSTEQGAYGYILNRPFNKTVGDLLTDDCFAELEDIPVFLGGPVSTEHLTFSAIAWSDFGNDLQFVTHLSAQEAIMHQMEGFSVRAFVGYAGWSEGQLEDELEQDAWITRKAQKRIVETVGLKGLWKEMLRDLSPWHQVLADEPDELGLN